MLDGKKPEPINDDLEALAVLAEGEDAPETASTGGSVTEDAVSEVDQSEAIERMAIAGITALAWGVKTIWGVEHSVETKREGVEKLKPCLQHDNMPPWLVALFGRFGAYIVFVAFLGMAGISTYGIVKQRREQAKQRSKAAVDGAIGEGSVPAGVPEGAPLDPRSGQGFATAGS